MPVENPMGFEVLLFKSREREREKIVMICMLEGMKGPKHRRKNKS